MTTPVSLVIPAYNEANRLPRTLQTIQSYRREHSGPKECIVVDDGSEDGTVEIAIAFSRANPWCRLWCLETHSGKGAAVRAGMLQADCEQVFFTDADLAASLDNLMPASRLLSGSVDVLLGSRTHPDARITRQSPTARRAVARLGNRLIRSVTGLPYRDTQCGFKGFNRGSINLLFDRLEVTGFMFDVEILVKAKQAGMRIAEFPVLWANQPGGKFSPGSSLVGILTELYHIHHSIHHA